MSAFLLPLIYLLFFFSGAAALVYEVAWVRSLSLLFGGSHLAVTTVLSVFMAGLALGSYLIGKRVDALRKPLKLYGLLEIGIAVFAVAFVLLMYLYPVLYVPLARAAEDNSVYLSSIRVLFAVVAMIVPTTLMGGTLPVLSRFVSMRSGGLGGHLSFLYGFNTLGAVVGTLAAGFVLLPNFSLSVTVRVAIATNIFIGMMSLFLQKRAASPVWDGEGGRDGQGEGSEKPLPHVKLVLWGIGISGFCALGYEVLWTRVLSMVIGASVYGFTIMLVAFLTGIALGSKAFGLFLKMVPTACRGPLRSAVLFGCVQVVIGLAALTVTYFLRDLPAHSIRIENALFRTGVGQFEVRQGANFLVAFSHMFLPAFFMGFAFPLAGKIRAEDGKSAGGAVGEVLAYNTLGAISGAAISGFALIYLFGIERSLQLLTLVNVGAGLLIASSSLGYRSIRWGVAGATAAAIAMIAAHPGLWRMWDPKYFAIYRLNTREAFATPFNMKDAMENTDVLYYAEGAQATVSSIKVRGGYQAFITNGRIEASSHKEGIQCQYTLGHLPMLLNRRPRKVFVLGTGSGMTLGATSAHPGVEEIVLAEIEPKVIGVARTFSKYNHNVLDNPKLKIVFNDGRNYLMTTKEKFDVITADPIHPWFSGAGYLYTTEYFRLAAERLRPGGVVCQWLPIYELSVEDLKCVVRTFTENFKYTLLWLTRNDAELLGSNDPIVIDEGELERRIAVPGVMEDLKKVHMGSADDFLGYFVMGTEGMKAFGEGGVLNTDDNLHLEFSAPLSLGVPLQGWNAQALYRFRESILPYLLPDKGESARAAQVKKWDRYFKAGETYSVAHVLFLRGRDGTPEFRRAMEELDQKVPDYAPLRFLKGEIAEIVGMTPTLVRAEAFPFVDDRGGKVLVEISAVKVGVGEERVAVIFVDNRARTVFGQLYIDAPREKLDSRILRFTEDVMSGLKQTYKEEAAVAASHGKSYPPLTTTMDRLKNVIATKIQRYSATWKWDKR